MADNRSDKWPDAWVVDAIRADGRLDTAAEARLAGSDQPTAWAACRAAKIATAGEIVSILSRRFGIPVADMSVLEPAAAAFLAGDVARRLRVAPLRVINRTLEVACCEPADADLERAVAFASQRRVRLFLTDPTTLDACLDGLYPSVEGLADAVDLDPGEGVLRELAAWGDGSVPEVSASEVVDALIAKAVRRGASDVHLEPQENFFGVRYRIDGVLHDVARIPRPLAAPITSRVKVLANLDIADRMRPQDGRAAIRLDGRSIDLRISTLPVGTLGEKTVVRLLDSGAAVRTLAALGYLPDELKRIEHLVGLHEGLVLVTGPTGSGKTTTLYAALRTIQTSGINIVTVEDPVEYRLSGISQVQINERAGLTFSSALRSILRQDPDVVLVGEIRDSDTAEIAVQASLTGHLVLSTVHANDAPSTISRLVDIGVDSRGLASALKGVIAQRLLRRLCPACRVPCDMADLAEAQRGLLSGLEDVTLYQADGCDECGGTGYRGRLVVSEIAVVTSGMERAISRGASTDDIAELCVAGGMRTFWRAGLERVARGDTSLNELLDNIYPPMSEAEPSQRSTGVAAAQEPDNSGGASDRDHAPVAAGAAASLSTLGQEDVDEIFSAARRSPASDLAPSGSSRGRDQACVLLIDDDAEARRALRSGLEREGLRVVEAADGEAGMEYLRRVRPDFIVTELALPKLDGFGLMRALASDRSIAAPVLVVTSNADPSLVSWALELGAVEVLAKPIEPRIVGSRLHALLEQAAA